MNWQFKLIIKLFILQIMNADAVNILNLMGCASPSHHIWNSALVNALAARGHNVTVLSVNEDPNPPKNVHYILLEGVYDYMYKEQKVDLVSLAHITPLESIDVLYAFASVTCDGIKRAKIGLQTLLNYPKDYKFDLILYDFTLGPCILGFLHRFNYPPVIGVTAYNNPPYTTNIVGGHNYFSYLPHFVSMSNCKMSFWQRAQNVYFHAVDSYQREFQLLPLLDSMSWEIFGPDYPRARDLEQLTKLVLVNTHPSVDYPEPLPPNIIAVGGLQIVDPKPLEKDVDSFLSRGKKGAVLLSFGTNVKSINLGIEKQKAIVDAFKQLPNYNFLWKFESSAFPFELPANVMIKQWVCQNDVLNHSNVKAFVTHGGALSTYEATWRGVPMIGIPFIVDQYRNVRRSVEAGVSEYIPFPALTTAALKEKLTMVLTDRAYTERMAQRSQRLRDQPQKPIDRAVWWVEYILRHPDCPHLQSPMKELGFFRGNSLDIYGLLIATTLIVIALTAYVVKRVINTFILNPNMDLKIKTN